ncbi:MAG: DUF692 domain-containing protein [Pseudomonadales bacterium]
MTQAGLQPVQGAGLGLRRGLLSAFADLDDDAIDFMEVAPENWIGVGGRFGRQFQALAERFPLVCHGLSLSLGSPAPLDTDLLRSVRAFLDRYDVRCFTEHLSYCSDDQGHLYDLMPIPFTDEAVRYVADRIRQTQDILGRRIGIEHVSYYAAPGQELDEVDFVNAVLSEADCDLLLDVNNVYVNAVNFRYDPYEFIDRIDGARTAYVHIAGHYEEAADLRVDTHGSAVAEPVWDLLRAAYDRFGVKPTLLERDFNFPPMSELLGEVTRIRDLQVGSMAHVATG